MARTSAVPHRPGRTAAAILLLVLGFHAPRLAAQSTVADTIRAMELARGRAVQSADTAALGRMVAAEFVEISRLGTRRTRADNLRDLASGNLRLTSIKYDSLDVRLYGDVAILTGIAENTGVAGGTPFSGRIRYTRVFVRREGRWQAVLMQQTWMQ
jgi:ketosteroid isomerase-like protein